MKKLFIGIALLLTPIIYGQEAPNLSISEKISFRPLEVFASGVLILDFENRANLSYVVSKNENNNVVLEKNITKILGPQAEKMDLSTFENGYYTIRVFINSTEVKSVSFKKS